MLEQKFLAFLMGFLVFVKNVKSIIVLMLGINSVSRKAAAKPVGAVMHKRDRLNDFRAVNQTALSVDNRRNRTTRRNSYLSFL